MDDLPKNLFDVLKKFLPACPDAFCNDFDYIECILAENKDRCFLLMDEETKPYFIYGTMRSMEDQGEVDKFYQ